MSEGETVTDAPAPWELRASAYIIALKLTRARLEAIGFIPPELRALRTGPFSFAMFVDYAHSPVGPYRELLFFPGAFRYPDRSCFTITKIYVSTMASVVNGCRNWGLPKELADFDVEYGQGGERIDRVRMRVGGEPAVALALRHYPIGGPLIAGLIPSRLRTLRHTRDGRQFTLAPSARAVMRAASVLQAEIDPRLFPAFTTGEVLAAAKLPDVTLWFPEAQVEPATESEP
jgi:hypothetical protein